MFESFLLFIVSSVQCLFCETILGSETWFIFTEQYIYFYLFNCVTVRQLSLAVLNKNSKNVIF